MNIELLIKYFSGHASPEEALQIHDWKNENDINKIVFEHLMSVWHPEYAPNEDKTFNELWKKVNGSSIKRMNYFKYSSIAASVILLVSLFLIFYKKEQAEQFITQNETINITLPKNNDLTLYPHSNLSYSISKDTLIAKLIGTSLIDIINHELHYRFEFAYGIKIINMGTRFYVNHHKNGLDLVVYDGFIIAEKSDKIQETIKKNDSLVYESESNSWKKYDRVVNVNWDKKPLIEALKEIEKIFNIEIKIIDKVPKTTDLTLYADQVSLKDILDIVSETLNVSYKILNEDEIELY